MSSTALKSPVAALYVETGGVYFGLEGVDPWDVNRDARLYAGPHPVVAHPPCNVWGQLAPVNEARYGTPVGHDKGCFAAALGGGINSGECVGRPKIEKAEASRTPIAFRDLLIDLARASVDREEAAA